MAWKGITAAAFGGLFAANGTMAAGAITPNTLDYVYIPNASTGSSSPVETFSIDTKGIINGPLSDRVITKALALSPQINATGTVNGNAADFGDIVFAESGCGRAAGCPGGFAPTVYQGGVYQSINGIPGYSGAQLFSHSTGFPLFKTGHFTMYPDAGVVGHVSSGTLIVYRPVTYHFDVKGTLADSFYHGPFDVSFNTTNTPEGYGATYGDFASPGFSTYLGQGQVNGVAEGLGLVSFFADGTLEINNLRYHGTPGYYQGSPFFTGSLYDAQFKPGVYVETNPNIPDETFSLTITRVNGVPEPDMWALSIIGFGLVGALARRHRQVYFGANIV